jgi:hypothetical protein
MSHLTATTADTRQREFVLGRDLRATILTSSAETGGRHNVGDGVQAAGATTPLHVHTRYALNISSPAGFAELIARTGTPAHLATPETELDAELFKAVTQELGDVVLGPPGTVPQELAGGGGQASALA